MKCKVVDKSWRTVVVNDGPDAGIWLLGEGREPGWSDEERKGVVTCDYTFGVLPPRGTVAWVNDE